MGQGRPQQPELNRSGNTPLQPDSIEGELEARRQPRPGRGDAAKNIPEDNQPGHHPDHEQDKPDPQRFVQRFSNPWGGRRNGPGSSDDGHDDERHPVVELATDFTDRIRTRDVIGLATFPVHAGLHLARRYGPLARSDR